MKTFFSRLFSQLRRVVSKFRHGVPEPVEDLTAPKPRRPQKNSLRQWLMDNNYRDVAETIDRIKMKWKQEGKATRRNWWDVLAGDQHGNARIIEGIEIPVLKIAQIRQGKPFSLYALCRNEHEELPSDFKKGRRDHHDY